MPPYGEPDWASPGDTTPAPTTHVPATNNAPVTGTSSLSSGIRGNANFFIVALSLADFAIAAMMAALGVTALIEFKFNKITAVTEAFLAAYMIIFAVLLAIYEFVWWQPIASLNKTFRKNFGFMYGLKGKGFYLIFIAFLCLGMWRDEATAVQGLDWATGLAWLTVGSCHIFLSCCYPEANDAYKPATAGLVDNNGTTGAAGDNVV